MQKKNKKRPLNIDVNRTLALLELENMTKKRQYPTINSFINPLCILSWKQLKPKFNTSTIKIILS
jgi:hypothetical protein